MPFDAKAESPRIAHGFPLVAGGTRDRVVSGELRFVEESFSKGDPSGDERVIGGECGQWNVSGERNGIAFGIGWKIDGRGRCRWRGNPAFVNASDAESSLEIGLEASGYGIAVARMRRGPIFGEGQTIEQLLCIERDADARLVLRRERYRKTDRGAVRVIGEMVDITARQFVTTGTPVAFDSEKDVTALPVPVEVVDIRVERMIGGILGRVRVVGFFVRPDFK